MEKRKFSKILTDDINQFKEVIEELKTKDNDNKSDVEIITNFVKELTENSKPLDGRIVDMVDDKFFELK